MVSARLLYFQGCPNYEILRSILREEGISTVVEIDLGELPNGDPLKSYSSPTLLQGDRVLLGTRITPGATSCTWLTTEEMRATVRRLK